MNELEIREIERKAMLGYLTRMYKFGQDGLLDGRHIIESDIDIDAKYPQAAGCFEATLTILLDAVRIYLKDEGIEV